MHRGDRAFGGEEHGQAVGHEDERGRPGQRRRLAVLLLPDGLAAVGDAARLEVFIPEGAIVHSPRTGFMNPKTPTRTVVDVDRAALDAGSHHGATFGEHQAFIAAVRGEGAVEVTAEDGLRAVAIGVAAETSAREKRVVTMDELGF